MNNISREIEVLIRARYPLIIIKTYEEERAEKIINEIAKRMEKKLYCWSITTGIHFYGTPIQSKKGFDSSSRDPLNALNQVIEIVEPAIFIFKDFHPFMKDPAIIRRLREVSQHLKNSYKTLIIISPEPKIPLEIEKEIAIIELPLPGYSEIRNLLDEIIKEVNERKNLNINISEETKERIAKSALGLTLNEAENVFAKILVMDRKLDEEQIPVILREKEQIIKKSGILEYYPAQEEFSDIGGLDNLKEWLRKRMLAFSEKAKKYGLPAPKGVLLIGVQGCGKSLCAKAVSGLWKLPLLRFDIGRIFSSLVGSSEENMRKAIQVAESVAPAILWIDEIEKAFAGTQSSAFSDAGTTARVFGTFITWLQEKKSPVFVIATANDISGLPPELLRKGRFDEIFFVDLPTKKERKEIFAIHLRKRNRDPSKFDLEKLSEISAGFSGAEIEEAIISALFDAFEKGEELSTHHIEKAIKETVPLSQTMKEEIESLRRWAEGRARRASKVEEEEMRIERKIEI